MNQTLTPVDLLNSLLQEPSHREKVRNIARQLRNSRNEFLDYRNNILGEMGKDCRQLDKYKRNCLISTAAGSSIGILGSGVSLVGTFVFPPLAIAALIISAAGNVTSITSRFVKWKNEKNKKKKFDEYYEKDRELLEIVKRNEEDLLDLIHRMMKNEYFNQRLQHEVDIGQRYLSAAHVTVSVIRGTTITSYIMRASKVREYIRTAVPAVTLIGMVMDAVVMYQCVQGLQTGSELAAKTRNTCSTMRKGLKQILNGTRSPANDNNTNIQEDV